MLSLIRVQPLYFFIVLVATPAMTLSFLRVFVGWYFSLEFWSLSYVSLPDGLPL